MFLQVGGKKTAWGCFYFQKEIILNKQALGADNFVCNKLLLRSFSSSGNEIQLVISIVV